MNSFIQLNDFYRKCSVSVGYNVHSKIPQLVKHYFSIQDRKMILYKNWADRINEIKINVQSSFNSKTSSISRVNSALNFRMKQHSWRQIRAYRRSFREIFKKEISQ